MIETTVGGEKVRLQQGVVIFNADGTVASLGSTPPAGGAASADLQTAGNNLLTQMIPATVANAVTPSDSTPLAARSLWVGGAGNLSVRLVGAPSTTVVFTGVPAGTLLPIQVVRVMAATTATNIIALV